MKQSVFVGILFVAVSLATTLFGQEFITPDTSVKSLREYIAQSSNDTENNVPAVSPSVEVSASDGQSSQKTYKNANLSIMNSLESAKKLENPLIYDNLVKLIFYGTFEEKASFVSSKNYTFPKRFMSMPLSFENRKIQSKLPIQVCHKENCHFEEVCSFKKRCQTLVSLTCGSAGVVLIHYTAAASVILELLENIPSTLICSSVAENVCEDVKDCQNVEKCDTVCTWQNSSDIQPGECINTPTGTVCS